MTDPCPTCGSPVEVVHGKDGTYHYKPVTDPRTLGGDIAGPGGPYDRGGVVLNTENAILLDGTTVAMLDNPSDQRRIIGMLLDGRINRSTDRAQTMYLFDADGAAAIITELVALTKRESDEFNQELMDRMQERFDDMP